MFNVEKEDWGFTSVMPLLNLQDTTQVYIIDDILIRSEERRVGKECTVSVDLGGRQIGRAHV